VVPLMETEVPKPPPCCAFGLLSVVIQGAVCSVEDVGVAPTVSPGAPTTTVVPLMETEVPKPPPCCAFGLLSV